MNSKTATVTANFTAATGGLVAAKSSPSSVNSVVGGSQNITITAQDAYGNPIANQTIYIGTGVTGLWITQVNGVAITSSVNMGTTSSTSMQTVSTPIPLYVAATLPAYNSASVTGVTAYNLQTAPVVALTTGVDGTVSITLADGNVTYVANTATSTATNSYAVDPGQSISSQPLAFYSSSIPTANNKLGSVLVNWGGPGGAIVTPPVNPGFTFATVADGLTGNTIVNVTGTAANVTGVTVKGVAATYISSLTTWRAILTGTVTVSSSDITLSTVVSPVSAVDMTKSKVTKGMFGDAYVQVFMLSGVTPTSVKLADGTVLALNANTGAYEKDITYTGAVPTTFSVAVATASGTQNVTLTAQ